VAKSSGQSLPSPHIFTLLTERPLAEPDCSFTIARQEMRKAQVGKRRRQELKTRIELEDRLQLGNRSRRLVVEGQNTPEKVIRHGSAWIECDRYFFLYHRLVVGGMAP
jgi:hypothetical protein